MFPLFQGTQSGRGPLKDSEMQKVVDDYLKHNQVQGPDSFQMDYNKHGKIGNDQDYVTRMNTQVIQTCLNEVLVTGESILRFEPS